jgi:uncharacterized protein YfaS (alpha-2-macroglobulin family)
MKTPNFSIKKRFSKNIFVALWLILSLACGLPGWFNPAIPSPELSPSPVFTTKALEPTATPQPLPPALVEATPAPGSEIPLESSITLYFNQPMDHGSVEAALHEEPNMAHQLEWQDETTLVYHPTGALSPSSQFRLMIGNQARSASGLNLLQPVELQFHTSGFLKLIQKLPEPEASQIDPTSAIVAGFNQPVVPLGASSGDLPAAFSVKALDESPAAGHGEWVNSSTYIFYPEPALEGGKTYLVTPNETLKSTMGSPLESADLWTFSTALPVLISVEPQNGANYVRLDATIKLVFNQPMDKTSVEDNFNLRNGRSKTVAGKYSWNDNASELTFTPDKLLERNTTYQVSLGADTQAKGGTPLGVALNLTFHTSGKLAIVSSQPVQGGQKENFKAVSLSLSAPIPDINLYKYFVVTPEVTDLNIYYDNQSQTVSFNGSYAPATQYLLVVSPSLTDTWGGTLSEEYILEFQTAPLEPTLNIDAGTDVLFLTPQDETISVQAGNLPSLLMSQGSVGLQDFFKMLSPQGYDFRQAFHSGDQKDWRQTLDLDANRIQSIGLPVSPNHGGLAPGLYTLRFNLAGANFNTGPILLVSSNVNLTLKLSPTEALVWAVDLRSGLPVSGAGITLYDESGTPLAIGQTDTDGVFQGDIPQLETSYKNAFAVLEQPGLDQFGLAMANWDQGIAGWDFGINSDFAPPHLQAYIYTDRPIYRPGQTVYFRAIVRQAYNGRYTLPDLSASGGKYSLTLYGSLGQPLNTFDLPISSFGSGHGEYQLANDAEPGYYRLSNDTATNSGISFQVAEYRKPEIDLQVSMDPEQVLAGNKLVGNVNARYFFDAPAGEVPVHWALYARDTYFDLIGFQVGAVDTSWTQAYTLPDFYGGLGRLVVQGDGFTAKDGSLSVELATEPAKTRQEYTFEATLTDESGLPVSSRASVYANPAQVYLGVHPDSWVGRAGEALGFSVKSVDWDKNASSVSGLQAVFEKVLWVQSASYTTEESGGPQLIPQYTRVASSDFATNDRGEARLEFTPSDPGIYVLSVSGNGATSEMLLWVGGAGQVVWPDLPNQRLELVADREFYQPGDSAQVFIPNPFGVPVKALVTVERSVVFSHQVITLDDVGSTMQFQLSSEEAPNVYVAVTALGKKSNGQPDFRQGYVELVVNPLKEILNVSFNSLPQKTEPGKPVTLEMLVTDAQGEPAQGEFSLSLVDKAVLALADPNAPSITSAFYGQQPLGVRTAQALAVYANRVTFLPSGLGGGGEEAASPVIRQSFPDTAFWNAELLTDADGKAQVTVDLPDNLTTWQADVRGLTVDTRVGQADAQLITSKDLLIRPATPRFLVEGDHLQLAAVVQNSTLHDLACSVSLDAKGFVLDDASLATQTVNVPANGRVQIGWWGRVQGIESLDPLFSVVSGDLQDAAKPALGMLPVLRYTALQTFSSVGILDKAGETLELISLPRSFDALGKDWANAGNLQLEMTNSLAGVMLDALQVLEDYPYDCIEQTLSRYLPNLETYRLAQKYNLEMPELQTRMDRTLEKGLSNLLANQHLDGGWSWWHSGESDPYITAYVLFGLQRTQEAGIPVSANSLAKATDYLHAGVVNPENLHETWQLDRLAFIQFVLAESGQADPSGLLELYRQRDLLSAWSQALLAAGLEIANPGSSEARDLASNLETSAIRSASGSHWEESSPDSHNMQTPLSTTAMVVYTLAQRDASTPLVADAVRYLVASRQPDGGWGSTYSTAWTVLALARVFEGSGELGKDFDFSANLNGVLRAGGQGGGKSGLNQAVVKIPLSELSPDQPNALTIQHGEGSGRLYYKAVLNVFRPVEDVSATQNGMHISRQYYPSGELSPANAGFCPAGDCQPVISSQTGQLVRVKLSLTLENDAYYLLVEDHLPAGSKVLDTSLQTSQLGEATPATTPQYNPSQPFTQGWGWWLFSQLRIYDERIAWAVDYLPAGSYELTYTLLILQPGEFRVLPARAWQFYFPEVYANSAGEIFTIK